MSQNSVIDLVTVWIDTQTVTYYCYTETQIHTSVQETQRKTSRNNAVAVETEKVAEKSTSRAFKNARAEWFAETAKLPWNDFLVRTWQFHHDSAAGDPTWHTQLFWFVWMVRGHERMEPHLSNPGNAFKVIDESLASWSRSCRAKQQQPPFGFHDGDSWMEWFGVPAPDASAEFFDVWRKARFRPGHDPLSQALASARKMRLILPKDVAAIRPRLSNKSSEVDYEFFVTLAGHLQVLVGEQPIRLPCEDIGKALGVSKMTISRYRRWAIEDGFLQLKKEHKFRPGGQGDATEFLFNVERWNVLDEKAHAAVKASFGAAEIT